MSTKWLTKDLINGYSILNGARFYWTFFIWILNNFFNILSVKSDFLRPNKIINLNIAFEFWLFYTGNPTLRNSLFRAV